MFDDLCVEVVIGDVVYFVEVMIEYFDFVVFDFMLFDLLVFGFYMCVFYVWFKWIFMCCGVILMYFGLLVFYVVCIVVLFDDLCVSFVVVDLLFVYVLLYGL